MKEWCGEIAYMTPEGPLQSDLCHHDDGKPISDEKRRLLHECLDEWLDKSDGTGNFVLGIEYNRMMMQTDAITQAKAMTMAYRDGFFTEERFDEIIEWMESDDPAYLESASIAVYVAMVYYEGRTNGTISKFDRDAFEQWVTETDLDSEITKVSNEIAKFRKGEGF